MSSNGNGNSDVPALSLKRAEQVAEAIEEKIIDLGWPIGEFVGSEQSLINDYDVSRGVLREAVRLLEHHGTARMRRGPGGGLFVTAPNLRAIRRSAALYLRYNKVDIDSLSAARKILEFNVLDLVVKRVNDPAINARLRRNLSMESEYVRHTGANAAAILHNFHLELADLSNNPTISLFAEIITELQTEFAQEVRDEMGEAYVRPVDAGESHAAHEAIFESLLKGDLAKAKLRMGRHLDALSRFGAKTDTAPVK